MQKETRWLVILVAIGGVLIYLGMGSREKSSRVAPVAEAQRDAEASSAAEPIDTPAVSAATSVIPAATMARPAQEQAPPAKKDEPYFREYPEDSKKKLAELKALFAPADLRSTLKKLRPYSEISPGTGGFGGLVDSGVFRLKDGALASFRRSTGMKTLGAFDADSCFSLRLPDGTVVVGEVGQGSLEFHALTEPYCHLMVLNGTYYFLTLIEYSRWRREIREPDPSAFLVYRKEPNGEIKLIGEYLRASITGYPTSDAFEMSRIRWCESVPEPVAEL